MDSGTASLPGTVFAAAQALPFQTEMSGRSSFGSLNQQGDNAQEEEKSEGVGKAGDKSG